MAKLMLIAGVIVIVAGAALMVWRFVNMVRGKTEPNKKLLLGGVALVLAGSLLLALGLTMDRNNHGKRLMALYDDGVPYSEFTPEQQSDFAIFMAELPEMSDSQLEKAVPVFVHYYVERETGGGTSEETARQNAYDYMDDYGVPYGNYLAVTSAA